MKDTFTIVCDPFKFDYQKFISINPQIKDSASVIVDKLPEFE